MKTEEYRQLLEAWSQQHEGEFDVGPDMHVKSRNIRSDSGSRQHYNDVEESQGENSEVYVLKVSSLGKKTLIFIVKKEIRANHFMEEEALLQRYATSVHAPIVYAFNETSIMMEKCTPLEKKKPKLYHLHKPFKLVGVKEQIFEYNNIARALLDIRLLKCSVALYDKKGMYSEDCHSGNFMQRGKRIVRIDFDDMVFKDHASAFFRAENLGESKTSVADNPPEDPPYYFWWAGSFCKEDNQRTWNRDKWNTELKRMESRQLELQRVIEAEIKKQRECVTARVQLRLDRRSNRLRLFANSPCTIRLHIPKGCRFRFRIHVLTDFLF
jgi:hypothetical protein